MPTAHSADLVGSPGDSTCGRPAGLAARSRRRRTGDWQNTSRFCPRRTPAAAGLSRFHPRRVLTGATGALSLLAGLTAIFWPAVTVPVLVAVMGAWLACDGVLPAVTALYRGTWPGRPPRPG